ncbi:melanocyte-stimulating hormone receptor-like [Mercenaria mercenaria]|uniref:melanocyte-stimulating hormone receptor-like n=1 Tax=Mercenaria mercenaria TaxID=6596 RepID=UPI00234F8FD5|nr:melanocyte-stimulating hormone receptor-like [Mercenaria mercenaria]
MELFPGYNENLTNFNDINPIIEIDNRSQNVTPRNVFKGQRQFRNVTSRPRPLNVGNCYSCHNVCVFKAIEIVFVIGIIANIWVIILVLKDKNLRKPTYVSVACLALCDAIFFTTNLISAVETVVRSLNCSFPLSYKGQVVATINGICWFAANAHVSVIALVRYMLLLYPLKSQLYLTNRRVTLLSACVWVLGIAIWMTIYGLQESNVLSASKSVIFINVIWGIVYFTSLLVTSFLHFKKWRHIRQASRQNLAGNGNIRTAVMRMTKVILLVIILAAVLPLPRYVINCLKRENVSFPSETSEMYLRNIAFLLFLLNHTINPFLYAFISTPLKKSLKIFFVKQ